MNPRHPTARPAFTLVEAIIALVVLAVAVPGMFWAIRDAQARRADPVLAERARWLAAERLEDVLADASNPDRGYGFVAAANYPDESPVIGAPGFVRTTAITETGPTLSGAGVGYKLATVTVTYPDPRAGPNGPRRSLSLATVVTDLGP